jgi:N6-adenosine-specific RNA methylase IME4
VYSAIVIDPPWLERGSGKIKRGADKHYPLMREHQIIETILQCPHWSVDPDAHLYQWVTNNHLESGLFVMRALGFRYITNLAWAKDRPGLGQYFRGQHELCLFGVRFLGKGTKHRTPNRSISSLLRAARLKHSVKPATFHERVEARTNGPYLELFARAERSGWTTWGNEL